MKSSVCPTAQEPNIQIQFQGYSLDLFMTDDGSLGITVERSPVTEDGQCRDIFVSPDLRVSGEVEVPKVDRDVPRALRQASILELAGVLTAHMAMQAVFACEIRDRAECREYQEFRLAEELFLALGVHTTGGSLTARQAALLQQAGFKLAAV